MIKAQTNNWRNSGSGTLSTSSANFISPLVICKVSKADPSHKMQKSYYLHKIWGQIVYGFKFYFATYHLQTLESKPTP